MNRWGGLEAAKSDAAAVPSLMDDPCPIFGNSHQQTPLSTSSIPRWTYPDVECNNLLHQQYMVGSFE